MILPRLGVVVVTFNATDVILDCLESLMAATGVALDIVVVDNDSQDGTIDLLKSWAAGTRPYAAPDDMPFDLNPCAKPIPFVPAGTAEAPAEVHNITLIETGVNGGFAGGVNRGLKELAARNYLERFWVLNPDSAVPPETPRHFALHDDGPFALMGGRVLYYDTPDMIQIDGGILNTRTGVTGNIGLGQSTQTTPVPAPTEMAFITGASLIASRAFYEAAGPMPEQYFLYYEEVDWARQRGDLPLAYCPDTIVYHRAGTAIGSATLARPASPFSQYFKHRARLRFMRRFFAINIPIALAYTCAKAAQIALKGYRAEAWAMICGSLNLRPPKKVRAILSDEAAKIALPEHK